MKKTISGGHSFIWQVGQYLRVFGIGLVINVVIGIGSYCLGGLEEMAEA